MLTHSKKKKNLSIEVQQDLNQIDNEIAQVEQEINEYLKELGVLKHD